MAITIQQMISLGFKPSKRSSLYQRKYDTLIYPLNDTDFIYVGYNEYAKSINNKVLWKSFKQVDSGERITYPIVHLGDITFSGLKSFIERSLPVPTTKVIEDDIIESSKTSVEGEVKETTLDEVSNING